MMTLSYKTLFSTLKTFGLNRVYHDVVKKVLPSSVTEKIKTFTRENDILELVDPREIEPRYSEAWAYLTEKSGRHNLGHYLEFGVSHGTSLSCMNRVLKKSDITNVRMFGFDSFEGMPETAATEDRGRWKPGEFASPIEKTKKFLTREGVNWDRTFLIKGWYSNTLNKATLQTYKISKASVIMVDCDIYSSSKEALNFCKPLIQDEAIILFDDWLDDKELGEFRAYDEFLAENPQFKSTPFGEYKPTGKIFRVTNTSYQN